MNLAIIARAQAVTTLAHIQVQLVRSRLELDDLDEKLQR